MSHTLRGCVDWNLINGRNINYFIVTPFVGVWIETYSLNLDKFESSVTPFVGVWIETAKKQTHQQNVWVTPFVGVWIETTPKLFCVHFSASHPSWVCGLKPKRPPSKEPATRHTLRGCVDWNTVNKWQINKVWVTPFVGVWIETGIGKSVASVLKSHPSWVCGLKPFIYNKVYYIIRSHPSWVCGLKQTP